MSRLTVIDMDSIVYVVAYRNKDERLSMIVRGETRKFIDEILTKTEAEAYAGFFQKEGHRNYRHDVYPEYKANRPETPDYIIDLRPIIHETFLEYKGMTGLEVIESDDALSIFATTYGKSDEFDITYARVDKDLACIPGRHYNYNKKKFTTITKNEADFFARCQILSGDSGDNIPGVPGIGPAKAKGYIEKYVSPFKAYKAAAKDKKQDTWIRNLYRDYSCVHLLNRMSELKKYTDREEVDIFNIDTLSYDEDVPIWD